MKLKGLFVGVFAVIILVGVVFNFSGGTSALVSGDWEYEEVAGGVEVVGYKGSMESEVIPEELEGKVVLGVRFNTTDTSIRKIHLPETVEDVGIVGSMEEITIGEGSEYFRSYDGNGLYSKDGKVLVKGTDSGDVRQGTEEVGTDAFLLADLGGKEVTIPDTVRVIGERSFLLTGITGVNFPEEVEHEGIRIGEYAFQQTVGESSIEGLNIPPSVVDIGNWAFAYAIKNGVIVIKGDLENIGENAFHQSEGLDGAQGVAIDADIGEIKGQSFYRTVKEGEVTIEGTIGKLEGNAFMGSVNEVGGIEELYISADIGEVGDMVFSYNDIKKLEVTGNIENLTGMEIFSYNKNIEEIYFGDGIKRLGTVFNSDDIRNLKKLYLGAEEVTAFASYPWGYEVDLDEFEFGPNVKKLGSFGIQSKFYRGTVDLSNIEEIMGGGFIFAAIEDVILPKSNKYTRVEGGTFQFNDLRELYIPSNIREIGGTAFSDNNITELEIPKTLNKVESGAFVNNGLEKLVVLNRNLEIEEHKDDGNPSYKESNNPFYTEGQDLVVYGYVGSTAEEFVAEYAPLVAEEGMTYTFIPLDEEEDRTVMLEILTGGLHLDIPILEGFENIKIGKDVSEYTTSLEDNIKVKDLRGQHNGWKLNIAASELVNGESELANGSLFIEKVDRIVSEVGELDNLLEGRAQLVAGEVVSLVDAKDGKGMGTTSIGLGKDSIGLRVDPKDIKVGNYEGTITWSIEATPST